MTAKLPLEVHLGPVELVPPGEGRTFQVGAHSVAIFRNRAGSLFATDASCPHRNAPLADGLMGDGTVICPYHAYKFDLATGHCLSDAQCHIRSYPVREELGTIVLNTNDIPTSG